MHVLGIETATAVVGVAVAGGDGVVVEYAVRAPQAHSRLLLDMVAQALRAAGLTGRQLGGVAVSAGPGSFTGLRIGFAAAKTLAQVWGLPLVPVSTLEALAYPLVRAGATACALVAARRDEVYAGLYAPGPDGMRCLAGPVALPVTRVAALLERAGGPVTVVGDRAARWDGASVPVLEAPRALNYPRPGVVAEMGYRLAGQKFSDPVPVQPFYLRAPRVCGGEEGGL